MSEWIVFKRSFGDLDVWAEDDGGLSIEWAEPTDETRSWPIRLDLSADELAQILALREKVKASAIRVRPLTDDSPRKTA
jgi:hypothetical protein